MAEEEEKSPTNHFAKAGILTHDLNLLSRALYPLDHGALPYIHVIILVRRSSEYPKKVDNRPHEPWAEWRDLSHVNRVARFDYPPSIESISC